MSKEKFIVLRNSSQAFTRDIFAGPMFAPTFSEGQLISSNPVNLKIDYDLLSRSEIPRISRLNDVMMVAPIAPMKLIAPINTSNMITFSQTTNSAWGVEAVAAHTSPYTGKGVTVAVLDTGCSDHRAFNGVTMVREDFTGEGNEDLNGHGTHCAGTFFGQSIDNFRIGIAPGIHKALIGKVFNAKGEGTSDNIIDAINWAVKNGAHIISMSLGMDFPGWVAMLEQQGLPPKSASSQALEGYRLTVQLFEKLAAMIKSMGLSGLSQPNIIVAAAGNESQRDSVPAFEIAAAPPSVADGIISVAAVMQTNAGLKVAPFSNAGVNISAPGFNILSAKSGGEFVTMNGTSMATPHVAGVAALYAEKMIKQESLNSFRLTANVVGSGTTKGFIENSSAFDLGAGLVQAPQE